MTVGRPLLPLLAVLWCAAVAGCGGRPAASDATDAAPRPVPLEGVGYRAVPLAATASSTAAGHDAAQVFAYEQPDGAWKAAGASPQWLAIDLGDVRTLRELRLRRPAGAPTDARHRVMGGASAATFLLGELGPSQLENDEYRLQLPQPLAGIRHLRIETTSGDDAPSWARVESVAQGRHRPRWFGYYADAFAWTTPATAAVRDHVNLSWISASADEPAYFAARLQAARDAGLQAAVALPEELFFANDLTLRADGAQRWAPIADALRPHVDAIAFVSPIDEPYSLGRLLGVPSSVMLARLEAVASMIRADFPGMPLAFSFSSLDFDGPGAAFEDLPDPLPDGYALFGFDCYGSWDACGDPAHGVPRTIPWYVRRIGSALGPGQQMFLFADAFLRQPVGGAPVDPAAARRLMAAADRYLELALNDTNLAGLFVFLYQDDYVEAGDRFLGVVHWPELADAWRAAGTALTRWP